MSLKIRRIRGTAQSEVAVLEGGKAWNPDEIADGDSLELDVPVEGAALGDLALGSFSLDLAGCSISAYVSAADVVTINVYNNTGGAVNLAAGHARALVFPK